MHGCKPFMVTACDNDWNTWMFEWEVNPINREPIYTPKTVKQLITLIEQYDELIFHNYSFDIKALWLIDEKLKELVIPDNFKIHDTKVQSHIRNSNEPHGLKLQAVKYLREGMKDEEHLHKIVVAARRVAKQYEVHDDDGKLHPIDIARAGHPHLPNVTKEFPMCDFWLPAALHRLGLAPDDSWATACAQYGTRDAERTQGLHQVGIEAILSQNNTRAVYEREMALAPALLEMETTGTTLHKKNFNEALGSTIHDLDQGLTEVKRLAKFLGKPDLNPNSGKQLQKLIYGDFKLKPLTYTKSGNPSTDAENLEHHIKVLSVQSNLSRRKQTFRKFLTELIAYKRLKTASTYLNNYAGFRIDNTLYPSLDQTGTRTTRFSSSNPNGQNISKGHEEEDELSGTKVRKLNLRTVFGPRRGRQWIAIDYSQLQLRIFAFLSQEQSLQDAFAAGWDFHTFVACRIFNTDSPSDLQRRIAKNVNFALIFGAGQAKVDATAGMPGAYDLFRSQFPSVDRYMSSLIRQTRRTGVVWTAGGYPLRIPKDRAYACVNYAVQGTEGDIVKDALHKTHSFIRNDEQYNDVRLILTVHDELLFESPTSVQFPVDPICEIMENAGLALGMTTPVEASLISKSWDAKEDIERQILAV